MKRIIVVGGGFAGMWAALAAARKLELSGVGPGDVDITLINRDGYHCIRPRLYEQNPEKMKAPLLPILEAVGINFVQGRVTKINTSQTQISVQMNRQLEIEMSYDNLVLAAGGGAAMNYALLFLPELLQGSPGLAGEIARSIHLTQFLDTTFSAGVLDTYPLVYLLATTVFFLYLTWVRLASRRWLP